MGDLYYRTVQVERASALFEQAAREHGVTARRLGVVSGARLTVEAVVDLDVPTLQRVHRDALVSIVGD